MRKCVHILAATVALVVATANTAADGGRSLRTEDVLRIESLGEATLSPDGHSLAFVVRRSRHEAVESGHVFDKFRLAGNDRADVWLAGPRGTPQNLTGIRPASFGHWMPTWSPDGERIAMLSTRGGSVTAWVWERRTGTLRQLHQRAVDLQFAENPLVWLDATRLAFAVLPKGERPLQMDLDFRAARRAMELWPRFLAGSQPTASVLESRAASDATAVSSSRPPSALVVIDVEGGGREITQGGGFRNLTLSPDGRSLAFLKQVGTHRPAQGELLAFGRPQLYFVYQAVIVDASNPTSLHVLPPVDVYPGSLRWSPDSGALAFVGTAGSGQQKAPEFFICEMAGGTCRRVGPQLEAAVPSGAAAAIVWSSGGALAAFTRPRDAEEDGQRIRRDWWMLRADGDPRNLTAQMKSPPTRLCADTRGAFAGLAAGALWRIGTHGETPTPVDLRLPSGIDAIAWPGPRHELTRPLDEVVVTVGGGQTAKRFYRVDLARAEATPLNAPPRASAVTGYDASAGVGVLTASDGTGTYLWRSSRESYTSLYEGNTFLRGVAEPSSRRIQYRSLDGRDLHAWVLLPPGYEEGAPLPTVAWVYAGWLAGERLPYSINSPDPLNPFLLAAHGYVVLLPSMPLGPIEEAGDPYMELTKGVLPAVDKAVELGLVDPRRLGVIGHSFGGFSTYGLITQTTRFRAAVALAGISDLVGLYGPFDPRLRYEASPLDIPFGMATLEAGQFRMRNPPWNDFARYVRNSPLHYVDRVTTPLLVVHGDLDFVPMSQGETFFSALHRQGKRASMVRYWGEGHVIESPANIADMWSRIHAWFDEFLHP